MRSPSLTLAFPSSEQLPNTHRDVKELLCVVQHTDPDADVPAGGHGWRPVRGVQCADAKSLRRSETLPCSKGSWLWVQFCHDEERCSLLSLQGCQERKVRATSAHYKTISCQIY